jgi:N-acyl-D-aspartate/D-glutamate deacylase
MSPRFRTVLLLLVAWVGALPAAAQDYDLVIIGGRVMDPESGLDALRNVGVADGKIAAVTEKAITGKETINAK